MEHRLKNVARTRNCKIDHCSCGAVHVAVGSTTVRINEAAARELRDALVTAMTDIDKAAATTTAVGNFAIVLPGEDDPKIH